MFLFLADRNTNSSQRLAILAGCANSSTNFDSRAEAILDCLRLKDPVELFAIQNRLDDAPVLSFAGPATDAPYGVSAFFLLGRSKPG
jgi:hypothetical protein